MAVKDYSTTPADNNKTPPNGAPEGMSPSSVNDTMRQMMADTRDFYNNLEWRDWGYTPSYVSSTSFSLDGDMTDLCSENRRVKLVGSGMGTIYGTITGAVYASTATTVTVDLDSGSITSGLTNVLFGIDTANAPIKMPEPITDAVDIDVDDADFDVFTGKDVQAVLEEADAKFNSLKTAAYENVEQVREIPSNSKSTDYTLVLLDAGKHIRHPPTDTTARTWTIPANSSVPFPVGTAVTFVNQNGAGVITIACADTMRLAGDGSTGSRTLAANGIATALKITATEWIISGVGLS